MGVAQFLLLCSLFVLVTAQDCGRPELEENMVLENAGLTFQDGSSVDLGCIPGYLSSGPSSLTCRGGTWSTVRMTCTRKNCGSAGDVRNGDVEYPEGTSFGAVLQVTCNTGFKKVGGTKVMACGVQGAWTGRLPECEAVVCEDVPAVENANVSPVEESYRYSASIKYTCFSGYTLIGQASLTCSENGTFTPNPPECRRVQCDEPVVKNGQWVEGARPPYKYLSTVTYKCNDGFKMDGEGTIVCEKDNNWSPRLPTCKLNPTTPKATTTTTPSTTTTTTPTSPKKPGAGGGGGGGGGGGDLKPEPPGNGGNNVGMAVGITVAVIVLIIAVILGVYYMKKQRADAAIAPTLVTVKASSEEESHLTNH